MIKTQNNGPDPTQSREGIKDLSHHRVTVIYMDKSDREIWNSFRKGDEDAFNFIYRKNVDSLYNYGYQICKDKDLVKDCIHTLFVDLRKKADKLSEVSKISGYLFTAFHRELFRLLKAKRKIHFESIDEMANGFLIEVSHETKLINQEFSDDLRRKLDKAVNQLPVKQRQALLLLYQEELSYKEIAKVMNFSEVKTARTLVYKAISSVKSNLGLE
jgi:RNA polymerase sigma factor (sigma-70 family)